jgi:hypothetical protein
MLVYNATLKVKTWNLPSGETCPGKTAWCIANCYAGKGNFTFPSTKKAHTRNLALSRKGSFVEDMAKECQGEHLLRIHSSGDFYSVDYIEKWIQVAKLNPKTQFLAYTRTWRVPSFHPALRRLAALANFTLIASIDPSSDGEPVPSFMKKRAYLEGSHGAPEQNCMKQLRHDGSGCPECAKCWIGGENVCFRKH